jgi:CheY-like chemotaxis protein/anti-sigma regulatory factor (Ser/Thr protein kinase)
MTSILVVDDSEVDRRLVAGLLRKDPDFVVEFATSGRQALERIRAEPPELIITDLRMEEIDGLDLITTVRREKPLVPVILMTARGNEEIALAALRAGAASYSPKSELSSDLLDTVRSVLSVARRQRSHSRLLRCMRRSSFSFELENDISLIAPMVGLVQEKMGEADLGDEADRLRMGIAVEEALTNALYHGNLELNSELRQNDDRIYYDLAKARAAESPYCDRRIYVETRHTTDEVSITIRDQGKGFNPAALPDPTEPENLERAFGRGMLLITTFMDEVRHNDSGNEITMIKRRTHAEAAGG